MRALLGVVVMVAAFAALAWKPVTPDSCRTMCAPQAVAALSLLECRCGAPTGRDGGSP